MDPFIIKCRDTQPSIGGVLQEDGVAVDLTGATITFLMRPRPTRCNPNPAHKVSAAAVNQDDGAANRGKVQYNWQAGDTDTPGTYDAVFKVSYAGLTKSYPSSGFILVLVADNVT